MLGWRGEQDACPSTLFRRDMLTLNGIEYRPDLAAGYRWKFDLSPNSAHITIDVYKSSSGASVYSTSVEVTPADTAEEVREKVLRMTKSIANMIRPWNPEYAPMAAKVLRSLQPPEDAQIRTSDEPVADGHYGPRTSGALKLTTTAFGRDK